MVLVDIGSTFTKVIAVNLTDQQLTGQASAPTTPQDVSVGLQDALEQLKINNDKVRTLASSSAAGGLQMVAIGLVEDLTAKAAKMAALGAGARVMQTYSFKLTDEDWEEITNINPDIILLAGGTDGGNSDNILHNAKVLASLPTSVPIIIAGNRCVSSEVAGCFPESFPTYIAPNVMPKIGQLQVEPAREAIRKVFMEKIIYAKGLNRASRLIDGIFMPTPAAVLRAGQLLSKGFSGATGWGDLLIVDVGGATTDVHSLSDGMPSQIDVVVRGLPEPFAKRTVEGDLGVRVSVLSLLEAIGLPVVAEELNWDSRKVKKNIEELAEHPEYLPKSDKDYKLDKVLGHQAVKIGVGRHVGYLSELYTPSGLVRIQEGKDLSKVTTVIGTGGVLINSTESLSMLKGAAKQQDSPFELRPSEPRYFLDEDYIMASMGLLAQEHPRIALKILKDSLEIHELGKGGNTDGPTKT